MYILISVPKYPNLPMPYCPDLDAENLKQTSKSWYDFSEWTRIFLVAPANTNLDQETSFSLVWTDK